jgi:hypothetical protein
MVDDVIDHIVKLKHETDAVMALYREVYQDMQKKAEQLTFWHRIFLIFF